MPATAIWDELEQLTANGRSHEQHEDAERDALLARIDRPLRLRDQLERIRAELS